jgi:hypothetical protein
MCLLDQISIPALKMPQPERLARSYLLGTAFLSTDGIKCDTHLKERTGVHAIYACGCSKVIHEVLRVFCSTAFTPKQAWCFQYCRAW